MKFKITLVKERYGEFLKVRDIQDKIKRHIEIERDIKKHMKMPRERKRGGERRVIKGERTANLSESRDEAYESAEVCCDEDDQNDAYPHTDPEAEWQKLPPVSTGK